MHKKKSLTWSAFVALGAVATIWHYVGGSIYQAIAAPDVSATSKVLAAPAQPPAAVGSPRWLTEMDKMVADEKAEEAKWGGDLYKKCGGDAKSVKADLERVVAGYISVPVHFLDSDGEVDEEISLNTSCGLTAHGTAVDSINRKYDWIFVGGDKNGKADTFSVNVAPLSHQ